MGAGRIETILIMGVLAFAVRALPQLFFVGRRFPPDWDRFLRYLSYAFICSIVATTLFMTGGRFEAHAAPQRALALIAVMIVARRSRSAVTGMMVGTLMVLLLSWMRW